VASAQPRRPVYSVIVSRPRLFSHRTWVNTLVSSVILSEASLRAKSKDPDPFPCAPRVDSPASDPGSLDSQTRSG
jgi:hypothetical protein